MKTTTVDGDHIRVEFDPHGVKLVGRNGDALRGFMIAGEDGVYRNATAKLDGNAVIVRSDLVAAPKTVRYAWSADPEVDLYNDAGLPAAPFRTDTQAIAPIIEALRAPASAVSQPQITRSPSTATGRSQACSSAISRC